MSRTGPIAAVPPVLRPETPDALAEAVAEAVRAGRVLLPRGHGTRGHLGAHPATRVDAVLETGRLDAVVDYEPGDLTITVQAGMSLAGLDGLLAGHGQWLPLQPYRRAGTVGGLLASGADGVLALAHGRPRDLLIGARAVHGDGRLTASRGRVVKNVAGYDVPRLLAGSLGTLGVIVEASLKLLPRPERQLTLVYGFESSHDAFAAARAVLAAPVEPSHVDVLCGACTPQLAVGLDGGATRVAGLRRRVHGLVTSADPLGCLAHEHEQAARVRRRLEEPLGHEPGAPLDDDRPEPAGGEPAPPDEQVVLRCAVPPARTQQTTEAALAAARRDGVSARADARPGLGLVFVTLLSRDRSALRIAARKLLEQVRANGHATLHAGPLDLRTEPDLVWGPPPPDHALMRAVKAALDPAGCFAAGRFVGGL